MIFGTLKVKVTPEYAMKALAQCRGTAPLSLLTSTHFELHATLNSCLSKSLIRKLQASSSGYQNASDPGIKQETAVLSKFITRGRERLYYSEK